MIRLRRFAPLLVALLVVAGAHEAWALRAWAEAARVLDSPAGVLPGDILAAGSHLPAPTYLAAKRVSLDHLAERGDPPRLPTGPARLLTSGADELRILAPDHSRIRSIQRSHLEFAPILAAARAGVLKSLNTAHPPPRPA